MADLPTLFADRIANVAVTGSLVRLEFAVVQPPRREGEQPKLIPAQTLVMPLDGFVQSFGMLETMVKKLVADGVLKAQPSAAPATAAVEKK